MKKTPLLLMLTAWLLPTIAMAQERTESVTPLALPMMESVTVELAGADKLHAQGWKKSKSGAWHKMLTNGVEVEIAHGELAYQRALDRLTRQITDLEMKEERTAKQDLRLLELLLEREELEENRPPPPRSRALRPNLFARVMPRSATTSAKVVRMPPRTLRTVFVAVQNIGALATSTSVATIFSGSGRYSESGSSSGTGLVVPSWAGISVPTWFCVAEVSGSVTLSGQDFPNCSMTEVHFHRVGVC